ncbi:MAG: (E)-4-hydroxy-3-methylbut-2-enyl-diphosphate synthase, partial [Bdellovibrionales bacterium]|nr:(E)-4-hydroxy-3-methylbut-2-enyl-diphosphate synthase [Bdellovibrionales bacterium]
MYTDSIYSPHRRKTRTVKIGDLAIGSTHPILVQSMTTTPTTDTDATVAQILSLVKVGCPLVRITVPRQADADNLKNIKKALLQKNISVPLVADIHFLPKLALQACDYVDKVRINPGNFADRKKFEIKEYSDKEYQTELSRVADEFLPIVRRAKENGIAMRIGTNHGSLSDRIMNRFGDTPKGMVESALEFIRIAREENFHDLVLSMKASNPFVMITAYRLLAQELGELSWDYPLHLGVTEAGDGQDGRIKSSIGISTLLFDGLGDTVRVSLTEDPEKEIPVAHSIVSLFSKAPLDELKKDIVQDLVGPTIGWDPYTYKRRSSQTLLLGNVTTG